MSCHKDIQRANEVINKAGGEVDSTAGERTRIHNTRDLNRVLKLITTKKQLDLAKIPNLPMEIRTRLVYYLVRRGEAIVKELIPPDFDYNWLASMGYLYETTTSYYTFIHNGDNPPKDIAKQMSFFEEDNNKMNTTKVNAQNIAGINNDSKPSYPKYTAQIMNLANQNAHATRPKQVGQLSDLFQEFVNETDQPTVDSWKEWYLKKNPAALAQAKESILQHVQNLAEALPKITDEVVETWLEDLVINKTFNGLYYQKAILAEMAEKQGLPFRLATPEEEAKGIDGFIGEKPISIKPESYRFQKDRLNESIDVEIIYYTKTKTGFVIAPQPEEAASK